ncbi:MAG: MBL fold metallo-hydrolase [Methanothrix sp.]|nr:MBL fold metallo-hydrolase [Methanothrix sp.]
MKLSDFLYFYPERGMLDCNTYVIRGEERLMIVDVGRDASISELVKAMGKDGLDPKKADFITNTHLHIDHTAGNQTFQASYGGRVLLTPLQKACYQISVRQTSRFFGLEPIEFEADGVLDSVIDLGGLSVEVIGTPGHSPESTCFYCSESKALICGDLLFDQNIGRSDLPGGDSAQMKQSIEKVAALEIELLLPGHMGIIKDRTRVEENFEFLRNQVFRWL